MPIRTAVRYGCVVAVAAALLCTTASFARAQGAAATGPMVSLKLSDGSIVVGRVTKQDATEVIIDTETLGVVTIPRDKITELLSSTGGTAETKPAASHWTHTAQVRGMYASAVVPGYVGATKGLQLDAKIAHRSPRATETFHATTAFQKTDPNPASDDEGSAEVILTRLLHGPFHLLSESVIDRNRVQQIQYRFTEHVGLGWNPIASKTTWLLIAPGIAYTQEQAPDSSRIRNVAGGAFEDANGLGFGAYEALGVTIVDGLSLNQDILMIHGFDGTPRLQYTGTANLIGMVTKTFGLSIGYSRRYDSTLPPPIVRTLDQLMAGIQLNF